MSQANTAHFAVRFRSWIRIALVCYWTAMFIGTHWPKLNLDPFPRNTDKILHFLAYAGLSFLMALYRSSSRRISFRDVAAIMAIVVVYSIADEILQYPVGRSCDVFDAMADWAGGMVGLCAFGALRLTVRRFAAT